MMTMIIIIIRNTAYLRSVVSFEFSIQQAHDLRKPAHYKDD